MVVEVRSVIEAIPSEERAKARPAVTSCKHAVAASRLEEITLRPPTRWVSLELRDLVEYRELLFFLVWRDIKIRYKQAVLGVGWAVIQPFLTMLTFTIFFGWLASIPSDNIPYPIFVYTALLPWTYFANALSRASNSVVEQEQIITKVYFPRLLIPIAAVLGGLSDFFIAFVLLIGMILWYGFVPAPAICFVPFLIVMAMLTALSVSLWLSALNVRYRDVRHIIPFLTQLWLFASPIVYPYSLVPEQWRLLYGLNPMAGVVEGFRWVLLGQPKPSWILIVPSVLIVLALLITGLLYFRRMEDSFADVV